MEIEDLTRLGLSKNEAIVYLSLVRFGSANAGELIRDTKLHKKLVYENLEKLIDKGLVAFITEDNRKVFKIISAHALVDIFEDKITEDIKKKKEAERTAKEINNIVGSIKQKQEALVYRGKKGVRTFYKELLEDGNDYIVFGAPEKSIGLMDDLFWRNFNVKRRDKKIKAKLIFNESIRKYGESIKNKITEIRYFDKDFEPLTETNIQEDRVAIIVWTEEPILFIIQDKNVAENYKKYFEKMWRLAKI